MTKTSAVSPASATGLRKYSARDASSKFGIEQRTRSQTIVSKIPWGLGLESLWRIARETNDSDIKLQEEKRKKSVSDGGIDYSRPKHNC